MRCYLLHVLKPSECVCLFYVPDVAYRDVFAVSCKLSYDHIVSSNLDFPLLLLLITYILLHNIIIQRVTQVIVTVFHTCLHVTTKKQ